MTGEPFEAVVGALGDGGDGRIETPRGPRYLPYTVPGDTLRLVLDVDTPRVVERLSDGPGRRIPACPHFEACGGCALQHVGQAAYADWKRARVERALRAAGLDADVGAAFLVAPGSRRRIRLAMRAASRFELGYRARGSYRIVPIAACPIAEPAIEAILAPLRAALGDCLPAKAAGEVTITALGGALDIAVEAKGRLELEVARVLAQFADDHDIARITWSGEPVVNRRPVVLSAGGIAVALPAGGFVQPTAAGEARLQALVRTGLGDARRLADLFAGCGPLGLALDAAGRTVALFEAVDAQVEAVNAGAGRHGAGGRIDARTRDLFRQPLDRKELGRFDGVILDPPRAGAQAQIRSLAESSVPVIAYASCNPATFARDARLLVDAGYGLDRVEPIDQFLYSPHVELFGLFRR